MKLSTLLMITFFYVNSYGGGATGVGNGIIPIEHDLAIALSNDLIQVKDSRIQLKKENIDLLEISRINKRDVEMAGGLTPSRLGQVKGYTYTQLSGDQQNHWIACSQNEPDKCLLMIPVTHSFWLDAVIGSLVYVK